MNKDEFTVDVLLQKILAAELPYNDRVLSVTIGLNSLAMETYVAVATTERGNATYYGGGKSAKQALFELATELVLKYRVTEEMGKSWSVEIDIPISFLLSTETFTKFFAARGQKLSRINGEKECLT